MSDPRGALRVKAGGKEYTLHLGMSVLGEMQAKHGRDFLFRIEPPADAENDWAPPLDVITDMIAHSLRRHHASEVEADRYIVDDIMAENPGVFEALMAAAFPDQKPSRGNAKRSKRAA